jgi:hypothetical protein
MPWRQVPKKDVGHCDKPRAAVNRRLSEDFRMGKPAAANPQHLPVEYIDQEKGTRGTETSKYPEEKRSFPE